MTSELEQEFYDTFGIEPEYKTCIFKYCKNKEEYDCDNCGDRLWHYPEITAEKLLEMICILNSIYDCGFKNNTSLASKEVKYLKMEILKYCILHKEQIKTQIQQLFKD